MTKLIFALLSVSILLSSCASSYEHNANWRQQGYDTQSETIGQLRKEGKLSIYEANQQMLLVSKNYFPNDHLLIGLWQDLSELAGKMDRGEITKDQYEQFRSMRWTMFDDANRNRHSEAKAIEAQQQSALFFARVLGGVGQSMQRNNSPVINCTTTSMPGVITTDCR